MTVQPFRATTECVNDGASTSTGDDTDNGTSTRGEKRKAACQGPSTGGRAFQVKDVKQIKSKKFKTTVTEYIVQFTDEFANFDIAQTTDKFMTHFKSY